MSKPQSGKRRLRLWVITPELHRHFGTERCLVEQIERWRRRFDVRLYTMSTRDVDLTGIDVRRVPRLPGPLLPRFLWWFAANTFMRRRDARSEGRPDAVFSPGTNALDADAVAVHMVFAKNWETLGPGVRSDLRKPGLRLRALHHIAFSTIVSFLERRIYSGPALLWTHSKVDARDIERRFHRPAGSVPVVPHAVDAEYFSPESCAAIRETAREGFGLTNASVLLLLANDVVKKGVDTAVTALASLPQSCVLVVAGLLPPKDLLATAREHGVSPSRVRSLPLSDDVLPYYAAADLLIAPSREDGFGLPSLEAMACGLPVIVSARAGVSELMEDGVQALILEDPEDSASLARLVERVLEDRPATRERSARGRALAESMDWDRNAAETGDLIERAAAERLPRRSKPG